MALPTTPATVPSNTPAVLGAPSTGKAPMAVPTPSSAQPIQPTEEPVIQAQPQIDQLTLQELTYIMASYFYYHASLLAHAALEERNPNFVITDSLSNPELLRKMEDGEKDVEQGQTLETESQSLNIPEPEESME